MQTTGVIPIGTSVPAREATGSATAPPGRTADPREAAAGLAGGLLGDASNRGRSL